MTTHMKLRLTGRQHSALYDHLFPGDDKEAVALALCGVGTWETGESVHRVVCVHKIIPIPYQSCSVRECDRVTWSTELLPELLKEAERRRQVIVKIHSHPTWFEQFSEFDDVSDQDLFPGISGWLDTDFPGISAIMLPNGRIIARTVSNEGIFGQVETVAVAGSDIHVWHSESDNSDIPLNGFRQRTTQTFGPGTTTLLSRLSIGIVGVSGTGSPTIEMLYRLGVGEVVLVDGDVVEDTNVGRIYNSTLTDADEQRPKVDVLADSIHRSGLPVKVIPVPMDLFHAKVVRQLAQCDIIFGCMDSIDGRNLLNKLCSFYSIPYFDLGVRLDADGEGGVDQVCGTVHYLQPDGSSLRSRGVYTSEQLRASELRRTNPEMYTEQVKSKYIKGIKEDRPAVISVNTLIASLAVNDLLARLHRFRDDPNAEIASLGISLTQTRLITDAEGKTCTFLAKYAGRGDVKPLLEMPILSERRS